MYIAMAAGAITMEIKVTMSHEIRTMISNGYLLWSLGSRTPAMLHSRRFQSSSSDVRVMYHCGFEVVRLVEEGKKWSFRYFLNQKADGDMLIQMVPNVLY